MKNGIRLAEGPAHLRLNIKKNKQNSATFMKIDG
jgi:hypothetical protein